MGLQENSFRWSPIRVRPLLRSLLQVVESNDAPVGLMTQHFEHIRIDAELDMVHGTIHENSVDAGGMRPSENPPAVVPSDIALRQRDIARRVGAVRYQANGRAGDVRVPAGHGAGII